MKTIVVSSYYGCRGDFFKLFFEKYMSLASLGEKKKFDFVFSSNLQESLKKLNADSLCISFLYHPYFLIRELSHFHFSLKDKNLNSLSSHLKEHVEKIKNLNGVEFLYEEILFSKKRIKTIYKDLLIKSNVCFEIEEFFSDPEKSFRGLASCAGLNSDLLLQAFKKVEAYAPRAIALKLIVFQGLHRA